MFLLLALVCECGPNLAMCSITAYSARERIPWCVRDCQPLGSNAATTVRPSWLRMLYVDTAFPCMPSRPLLEKSTLCTSVDNTVLHVVKQCSKKSFRIQKINSLCPRSQAQCPSLPASLKSPLAHLQSLVHIPVPTSLHSKPQQRVKQSVQQFT